MAAAEGLIQRLTQVRHENENVKGWAIVTADHTDMIKHFVLMINISEARILFACRSNVEPGSDLMVTFHSLYFPFNTLKCFCMALFKMSQCITVALININAIIYIKKPFTSVSFPIIGLIVLKDHSNILEHTLACC